MPFTYLAFDMRYLRFRSKRLKTLLTVVAWMFFALSSYVYAATPLREWRQQVSVVRKLADNMPHQAYQQALQLQQAVPNNATMKDRVRILNVLTRTEVYLGKTDAAAKHAQQALEQAKRAGDRVGLVEAQMNIAINAINRGDVNTSIDAVTNSVKLLHGVDRPDLLAEAMLRLTMSYYRLNLFDEAVTLALQNMEIAKQSDNPLALTYAYQGMAIIHEQSGRYQTAHDYYEKMRKAAQRAKSKLWEGHAMGGVAVTLDHLGDSKTAERLFQQAITLFRQTGFPFSLANELFGYADFLIKQRRYAKAMMLIDEEIDIFQQHHNWIGLWYAFNAEAKNLQDLNRKSEAEEAVKKAYKLAKKIGFPHYIEQSAQRMAKIAAQQEHYQQAYQYIAEATHMADRYAQQKASNRMTQLTEKYKAESKQRQINKLNLQAERQASKLKQQELQQKLLWTILVASLLLLSASAWFLLRLRNSNRSLTILNKAVQRSQDNLQATFNAIPDLLFVLDESGVFHELHSPSPDLLMIAPEDILNKSVYGVLPSDMADISMEALHQAQAQSSSMGHQIKLTMQDGVHWFELSVASKALVPGEKRQFIVLSRDITERKEMEQAMMASEQQFRALVENSPDGIVRYDREGRRIYLNPSAEQILGVPAEQVRGKSIDEWVLPAFDDEYKDELKHVIATGAEGRVSVHIAIDGKNIYNDIRLAPEFDVDGNVLSVLAVARDITSLKEAENTIEEAYAQLRELAIRRDEELEEERKRIARDMHDELGQYLTTLRMNVSVLRMQYGGLDTHMEQQLHDMMLLLDTTIRVVRQIASQLRPAQLDMGITAALEWLVDDFSNTSGVSCTLDSNCDDKPMRDELAISVFRIVQESLTNIARYANSTEVHVQLLLKGNSYYLQVQDNGIGFDPDKDQKASFGLLGIRERTANLGGEVKIISAPGKGTSIEATFPAVQKKENV